MIKLNNIYFEKWLLDSISSDSNRHLFFDFDEKLLLQISKFYSQSNSINFFNKPTSIWIYSLDSDKDYGDKTKISKICDADLVRERNLNESSNFIVLISKSSKILPCDSILSSSHNYFDSEKKYVEFISKKIFIDEYNIEPNLIEIFKKNLFEFSSEKIYQCFSKFIDPNSVLDFFGIIGDMKHLSYNGKSPYFKDFLFKVQDILTNESFSGLESRLIKNNVSNCTLVLNSFKQEGFNSARDFSRNLNNVFLEFTQKYRDCIIVDEWINALLDEEIDSIIEFDNKNSDDIFTVVKNDDKINDKGNKYVLNRSHLSAYLTNKPTVEWSVNKIVQGEYDNLDLTEKDKLLNVKSAFNGNKKSISIINYCDVISDNLLLDFSARIQLLFSNTDNYLNLKRIKTVSIENDSFVNFKNEAKSYIESNYKNISFDFESLDLNSSKLSIFQVKDKSLFENSDLCLQFRLLNKEAEFDWLFFQDMQGNFKLNYQKFQEIEMTTCISNDFFKDVKIILKNVSHNTLYLRLVSNGVSEIIIVNFIPDGKKAPLEVNNYFQKMQALNDFTSSSNRIIEIRSREKNIIQSFYLEDNFDNCFFPTIFNINFLNNKKNTLPEIIDIEQPLPNDFRPSKSSFESLLNLSEFDDYLIIRAKLKEILSNKLKSFDIKTIDDIDFSEFEFKQLSIEYIDAYYKVLSLNELVQWIDCFYFCEFNNTHNRLDNYPFAIFFSPLNPLVLYQLVWKMNLMKANLEKSKLPNSLSSIIKINSIENWVLKIQPASKLYISIHTNSTLFTGYILSDLAYKDNSLKGILKYFKVSYSQSIGYLSSSQIRSALNKSYSYLSNKTTFNIKIDGKLFDSTTNESILNWIDEKTNELSKLYKNFNFQVNIFDNREEICYPSDNLLAYYKDECKLDFNWYKGSLNQVDFDLTLITSIIPDVSEHNESDFENLSQSFTYKNLVNNNISKYNSKALYKDIFIRNSNFLNSFDHIINDLQTLFKSSLNFNQYRTLLVTIDHKNSEVLAISSDISNSFILEEVLGKTLWEFSIADYSYQDTGKGDYFLLANEQEIYINNFKKFLNEIDPDSQNIFQEFISYSKKTGLFELKHLISNQNSIKGFIASVSARKILNSLLTNSLDSFIIPYDVFKNRLHKIKSDLIDNNQFIDTQYPDFILVKTTKLETKWLIDIRLIEVKYRKDIMTPSEIDKILIDQTRNANNLFCKLNTLRKDTTQDLSLWNDSLSLILLEMSQFYFNNSSDINNKLITNFAEAINSEYDCRILQPLLIAVDSSDNIEINEVTNGSYIKIPQNKIHTIFSDNSEFIDNFNNHFNDLKNFDICSDCYIVNTDEQIEVFDTITEDTSILDYEDSKYVSSASNIEHSISEFNHSASLISKVILGKDISNREVVYYPKGKSGTPLPNYNVMVTGSSGKGKTQFIKSFIFQNIKNNVSFTIIDFKNDYSDNLFCSLCNLKKITVKLDGIPFNPLIPRVIINEDSKYYDVSEHINGICSVLASTFGLGDQQEAQLKRAVRDVFNNAGINPRGTLPFDENLIFPSFNEVGDYLESGERDLEKLYNRLDPLFDLNLFPDKYKKIGFENIINQSNIIKLSDIQNDKIKNAVAKILIVSAHGFYLGSNHKSNLEKYFVFDEAHRILDTSFVEKFIRECRAFGVGILLSSQQPDDFPDDVLGQLATKVIHGNDGIARLTKKIKALISFAQDDKFINNLKTFEAIVNSQDYNNFIIKTLAWPHLVVLETIAAFDQDGITLNDLKIQISDKDIKLSELDNLINNLLLKSYVLLKNDKYFIYKNGI
jgi:hypothetical protein